MNDLRVSEQHDPDLARSARLSILGTPLRDEILQPFGVGLDGNRKLPAGVEWRIDMRLKGDSPRRQRVLQARRKGGKAGSIANRVSPSPFALRPPPLMEDSTGSRVGASLEAMEEHAEDEVRRRHRLAQSQRIFAALDRREQSCAPMLGWWSCRFETRYYYDCTASIKWLPACSPLPCRGAQAKRFNSSRKSLVGPG